MKEKLARLVKNKTFWIVTAIVVVLAVVFGIMLGVMLKSNEGNKLNYDNQIITIKVKGEKIGDYSFEQLTELSAAVTFDAIYKPSSNPTPVTRSYSGIYLKDLLEKLDIDLTDKTSVKFTGGDGMQKSYTIADVLEENNVYITSHVNGKPFNKGIQTLANTMPEEDGGPFVVIKAKEQFSNNRVKLLASIEVL